MNATALRHAVVLVGAAALAGCAAGAPVGSNDATAGNGRSPDDGVVTTTPAIVVTTPVDASSDEDDNSSTASDDITTGLARTSSRVDVRSTGNRWIEGAGNLASGEPAVIELPDGRSARWIVPHASAWVVVLDDGSVVDVGSTGNAAVERDPAGTFDTAAGPPLLVDGDPVDVDALRDRFTDPLPDTRVVTDGDVLVALGAPSDRYRHGVLGDEIEATTIEVASSDGAVSTIVELDDPDVFEAVSPMLADIDGDGDLEVLATISNSSSGARVAAYDLDGTLLAETAPVGTGNRWRNLMAVAPSGPDGEVEVIDVQTPHIGGIVQFFRFDGSGELSLEASTRAYSTHSIGSRNLDLGIATDADGDGRLDVLVPTQDMRSLAVLTRETGSDTGVSESFRVDLGARLSTNVAASSDGNSVAFAVGTDDGRILIWPRT